MILQALKAYYDRKAAAPDSGMAPEGWEWREFEFLVVIDEGGTFVSLQDMREGDGNKKRGHRYLVPSLGEKKGNGIKSNLFWENIEYMFGIPVPTKAKPQPDSKRVAQQHETFCSRIRAINGNGETLAAIRRFIDCDANAELLKKDSHWKDVFATNPYLLLAIRGQGPVTEDAALRQAIDSSNAQASGNPLGICLVSGVSGEMANLEPPIKGVRGAQSLGASLVSCNLPPFDSYGKEQGGNAPVGKSARSAYASALNHLLGKDSSQKLQVGDATTVFWAARNTNFENQLSDFFDEPPKDKPDHCVMAVKSLYRSVETGAFSISDHDNTFYVLGLAPNSARIAIRFWQVDTVENMAVKIKQHFSDIKIDFGQEVSNHEREWLPLVALLVTTGKEIKRPPKPKPGQVEFHGKWYEINPNLVGEIMRSILGGLPYPQTMLQSAIRRTRAEQSLRDKKTGKHFPNVPYPRASLIKACINRAVRLKKTQVKEELKMSLDLDNVNPGYRLGRLFAALEKIQIRAHTCGGGKEPNTTIRDRYYGAASGTPVAVFSTLIRLSKHHLAKIENVGERKNLEKLLGQIVDGLPPFFPAHLSLDNQGCFAIGYYHQMQDFYTKKEKAK